jgi:proline iminopeptidase
VGQHPSLAYAEAHPERVRGLVLRGIFLAGKKRFAGFIRTIPGPGDLSDVWEQFQNLIPEAERGDMLRAYHRRLTGDDPAARLEAARTWSISGPVR